MSKTYFAKNDDIERNWYLINAEDQTLGRLSGYVAGLLIGKHKPLYSPHVDSGDFVVVVNAEKIVLTGKKMQEKKYQKHSGYPGGLTEINAERMLKTHPERVVRSAVKGMLPKSKLGNKLAKKLKVYAGEDHPHEAQRPVKVDMDQKL